jgi:hypothetical protein
MLLVTAKQLSPQRQSYREGDISHPFRDMPAMRPAEEPLIKVAELELGNLTSVHEDGADLR